MALTEQDVIDRIMPDGFECHWRVVPYFVDEHEGPAAADRRTRAEEGN